jgi:NADPH2:quinone reductase
MIANNQKLTGFALIPLLNTADLAADVAMLFDLAAQGVLKVRIGGRFALEDVASAHRAIESRSVAGKVVLVPAA